MHRWARRAVKLLTGMLSPSRPYRLDAIDTTATRSDASVVQGYIRNTSFFSVSRQGDRASVSLQLEETAICPQGLGLIASTLLAPSWPGPHQITKDAVAHAGLCCCCTILQVDAHQQQTCCFWCCEPADTSLDSHQHLPSTLAEIRKAIDICDLFIMMDIQSGKTAHIRQHLLLVNTSISKNI